MRYQRFFPFEKGELTSRIPRDGDIIRITPEQMHILLCPLHRQPLIPKPMVAHRLPSRRSILLQLCRVQEAKQVDPIRGHDNHTLKIGLAQQRRSIEAIRRTELQPAAIYNQPGN